jgi:hypothetical protein
MSRDVGYCIVKLGIYTFFICDGNDLYHVDN